jgi:hypothetical protein
MNNYSASTNMPDVRAKSKKKAKTREEHKFHIRSYPESNRDRRKAFNCSESDVITITPYNPVIISY